MSHASCTSRMAIFSKMPLASSFFASGDVRISLYKLLPVMAFSKIAGLEVLPRRPSLSMYFFNPPPVSRSLRTESIQGDCPRVRSALSGLVPAPVAILGTVVVVVIIVLLHLEIILYAPEGRGACSSAYELCFSGRSSHRILCFQSFNLSQPPYVPLFIRELSAEKGLYQLFGKLDADHS